MFILTIDPIGKLLGSWSYEMNFYSCFFRLFCVIVLASVLGLERSNKRHSAGLRTFVLVALAGASAGLIDTYIMYNIEGYQFLVSAACIVGVAIMSANTTLFTSKSQIKGITTSVALWATSFLGITFGLGLYTLGILIFIAEIISLSVLPNLERYLKNRSNHFEIHLELKNASFLKDFTTTIRQLGLKIDDIEQNASYAGSTLSVYSISVSITSEELKKYKTHSEIIDALKTLDYIYYIEEMN